MQSFALWLGYANSMLNPVIYVTFHQDFRRAFKFLLAGKCLTVNTLIRQEEYRSQYGTDMRGGGGGGGCRDTTTPHQEYPQAPVDWQLLSRERMNSATNTPAAAKPLLGSTCGGGGGGGGGLSPTNGHNPAAARHIEREECV